MLVPIPWKISYIIHIPCKNPFATWWIKTLGYDGPECLEDKLWLTYICKEILDLEVPRNETLGIVYMEDMRI